MSIAEHRDISPPPLVHNDLRDRVAGQALFTRFAQLHAKGEFAVDLERNHVHVGPEAHSWYTGLLGERRVARVLAELGPDATVLHSVPVGSKGSDIDHLVISQAGVFTINTKNHPGQPVWAAGHGMLVGGARVPYLRNAAHEAQRAERVLSAASGLTVPVTPVIAFVAVSGLTVESPPLHAGTAIEVVRDLDLVALVTGRPVFSPEQVERIVAAAVRPTTWGPDLELATEPDSAATALVATGLLQAFLAYESRPRIPSSNTHVHAPVVVRLRWGVVAAVGCALLVTAGLVAAALVALL